MVILEILYFKNLEKIFQWKEEIFLNGQIIYRDGNVDMLSSKEEHYLIIETSLIWNSDAEVLFI